MRKWLVEMASGDERLDCLFKRGNQILGCPVKYMCPGGVQQDVADAGFTMQKNWDAAMKGLKRGDSIALAGRHQKKMRLIVQRRKLLVADKTGKPYAASKP